MKSTRIKFTEMIREIEKGGTELGRDGKRGRQVKRKQSKK